MAAGNLSGTTTVPWSEPSILQSTIVVSAAAEPKSGGLSNSPSEEPVVIEEKSLPKLAEETPAQRTQRSLSVVIMQPIQLLPKYLRLNKSDLDLTEEEGAKNPLVVKPASQSSAATSPVVPVSTTQQEIWTMLQKDSRYMERNIYVEEEPDEEEREIIVDGAFAAAPPPASTAASATSKNTTERTNKRLKSPTVAKPISVLLGGEERLPLRLQLPKKKIKTEGGSDDTDASELDEFINGEERKFQHFHIMLYT